MSEVDEERLEEWRFVKWLEQVSVLALKEFAADMPGVHSARKEDVVKFILNDADAREVAMESRAIMLGWSR